MGGSASELGLAEGNVGGGEAAAPRPEAAEGSGRAIAVNSAYLVLGQAGTTILSVPLSAVLGRSLGAEDFGLFFLVTSMSTFAFVVVDWGQSQYVIREVAREPTAAGELLGTTLVLRLLGAVLVAGLTAGAAHLLGYDARTAGLAALMVGMMLPFFQAQAVGLVFRGFERMDREAIVSVLNKALVFLFTVLALLLGTGLVGAMAAQGFAGLFAFAVAVRLLRAVGAPALRPDSGRARELLVGGAPIFLITVAVAAHSYIDAVLVSRLSPPEVVGWFGAAKAIIGTLVAPATILATAAYPRLSRAAGDPVRFREELRVAQRPLLALAALGAAGTWLCAGGAIDLVYGADGFGPAAATLRWYAPALFLLFPDMLFGAAIVAVRRTPPIALAKVVNVIVATALGIALVPVFQERFGNGGIGVVVAFGASEIIMLAASVAILPRGTVQRGLLLDGGRAVVAGLATVLVFLPFPELPLVAAIPACVAVFGVWALLTGLVRRDELEAAVRAVRGRLGAGPAAGR